MSVFFFSENENEKRYRQHLRWLKFRNSLQHTPISSSLTSRVYSFPNQSPSPSASPYIALSKPFATFSSSAFSRPRPSTESRSAPLSTHHHLRKTRQGGNRKIPHEHLVDNEITRTMELERERANHLQPQAHLESSSKVASGSLDVGITPMARRGRRRLDSNLPPCFGGVFVNY